MPSYPLYVAFLWHMHQPYYKDIRTGKYIMPWVRFHGTKDYLDMVQLMGEYPQMKATFNMVPSLMEQILDYVRNEATDLAWDLTARPAAALNDGEKKFIIEKFFFAHYDNMISPYPRYRELFDRRGWAKTEAELMRVAQYFRDEDFRDLQTWYNLAWIDPYLRSKDPEMERLVHKGRGFTEQEKLLVLRKHRELLAHIVPTYREFEEKGQIEISCSPYYHPILPLICDTDVARQSKEDVLLPKHRFSQPEDARAQIHDAVAYHDRVFGRRPRGMWPSEGSVSPQILPLVASEQLRWIATDEEILGHSLGQFARRDLNGRVLNPELLYQPYYAQHDGSRVAMLFRDHFLSDLIGFQYSGWRSDDAARDLVGRLEAAHASLPRESERPYLVSIILDGENCWEHYREDGIPFLRKLYELLTHSPCLRTTRVSDYLDEFPPTQTLPRLFAGSWINHNFSIWIGHKEDNQSWDYLHEVRELVDKQIAARRDSLTKDQVDTAWKEIMIAEGSDWNWWYGDDHSSGIDEEFDLLYRTHLMTACQAVELEPPPFLYIPIKTHGVMGQVREPKAFIQPVLDGRNSSYYEWFAAGYYDPAMGGGSMHQAQYLLRRIYYGFDQERLYFRFDADASILKPAEGDKVHLNLFVVASSTWKISILLHGRGSGAVGLLQRERPEGYELLGEFPDIGVGQIIEVGVSFEKLELARGDEVFFYATLDINGRQLERCPSRQPLRVNIPTADFETKMWLV